MKKALLSAVRLLGFAVLFIYLFVHISYMCRGKLSHTRNNLSGYYDLEPNTLDVVFIGTSGTFSSFAPMDAYEQFGFTSYNFAINLMGTDAMPYAIVEAMKTQSPEVLVVDIFPFIVRNSVEQTTTEENEYQVRYNTDGYKYSLNRLQMITDTVNYPEKLSFYCDIIKYHDNPFVYKNFFCEYPMVDKGFNSLGYGEVTPMPLTDDIVPLEDEAMQHFNHVLQKCEEIRAEGHTQVLFMFYPMGDLSYTVKNASGNVNYLEQVVLDHGFAFKNWESNRDAFDLDYTRDYWNSGHFNIFGAEKVTKVVGAYLSQQYSLRDKRSEAAYEQWKVDLGPWHEHKSKYKDDINKKIKKAKKSQS